MIKAFATKLDFNIPEELLRHVVGVIEGKSEAQLDESYPVFAIGHPLVIFLYKDFPTLSINGLEVKPKSRLQIAGQIYKADISMQLKGEFGQIGLILHPLTPYYLFHKTGEELLNKWTDFRKSVPIESNALNSDLLTCNSTAVKVTMLFEFMKQLLDSKLPDIKWLDDAIRDIYQAQGNIAIDEMAKKANISIRHFSRKFKTLVGVSPKYFCKVIQLNAVFELLHSTNTEKLHHLALECGYFDHAHFIKDFKKMIGNSPNQFLNGNHSFVKEYMGRYKT